MPDPAWVPTVDQVGSLLRARTKDTNGVEQGTFVDENTTPGTRPTAQQAQAMISVAAQDVVSELGMTLPDPVADIAMNVVALGAAALIELTFFPEQVASGKSPYRELNERYTAQLARATKAARSVGPDGETLDYAGSVDDALSPQYAFPTDAGGLVDWETEF